MLEMAQNNFILNMIAGLHKTKSKQQIKTDTKALGDIDVKLVGSLDMPKTRKRIKNQLKGLDNMTFNVTPIINSKGVQKATKQSLQNAQKVANDNKIEYSFDVDKQKMKNQLKNFATENSKLFSSKEMTAKYNQLLNLSNVAKSKSELNALRKQLSAFRTELIATNKAGMTWSDKFKASIAHFAQYFSGASFIYAVTNEIRNAWTEAKTLDDSLVDLQKVTAEIEDRDSLYKYFDKALNKAQELNVKVGSLIDAITEFKKLGWSLENAELGGKWASVLSNVGDVDIETAIGSIKTAVASFDEIGGYGNDQMDKKLEAYVDLINNMSNKYSIDAQGLAESIRLSVGTLTEAHVSIEEAATMFATANKYYNDPSYLGNTAKIGSLRMRATSGDTDAIEELQEMGEEIDDLATASSTLRDKLMALTGVDIMVDEHTFKSYYDQLYEIAQVIDTLDDTSRANVLETLFGKSRSAGGAAILSGMKESSDAYKDAINSAGSATQEYTTWMQSADAATQRFSNALTATYQNFINGNTVRDIANLGAEVLEFANAWGIVEGAVKGFLALKIGTFITNGGMALLTATKQVEQYGKALQMVNNIPNGNLSQRFNSLKGIATATTSLTTAQLKQVLASKALTQQDRVRILQMQGMTREMALQKLAEMNLTQATNAQTTANAAQTASTFSLKSALTGLGATIKSVFLSNPVGIALMTISIGISAVTSAVTNHNQKMEETRQKNIDASQAAIDHANSLRELYDTYVHLSSIQDRTASEEESFKTVIEDVTKALGDKAKALEGLTVGTNEYADALANATKEELQSASVDATIGRKSAEEELQGNIWSDWSGSKVTIDSNNKGQALSDEAERAVDVVSDSLREFETINRTWKNLSWDISSDDPEEALAFYNALVKAREELVLASEDDEELLNTEIYADLNNAINTMSDSLDSYIQKLYEEEKLNYMAHSGIPQTTEDYKAMKEALVNTADMSEALKSEFNELLMTDFSNLSMEIDAMADDMGVLTDISSDLSVSEVLSQIEALSEGLDQLDKIYADVYDKEEFDWSSILNNDGFKEQFGELGQVYDDFVKQISETPDDLDACQEAFDRLATAYIYDSNALNNVTESTKDATIAMLQQMGVANATELVETRLASAKLYSAQYGKELVDATYEEIEALVLEGEAADSTTQYLAMLALEKIDINNIKIDTKADINNIIALANAAGASNAQLQALQNTLANMSKVAQTASNMSNTPGVSGDAWAASMEDIYTQDLENVLDDIKNGAYDLNPADFYANYTGGSSTKSAKDKASKSAKETKETFDWIENKLESVAKKTEKLAKAFEKTFTLSSTEKKFKQYFSQIEEEIKANQTAIATYQNKLNSIGLSSDWVQKIKNGNYSIDDVVNNDALTEQINNYQTYYDKLVSAQEKITELEEERLDAQNTYAEKVIEYQEKEMKALEKSIDRREALIGLKEVFGGSASTSDLKYQQDKNKEQITLYDNQIDKLKELQKTVSKGTDAWNTYQEQIDSNKESVLDIIESMAELATQIANLPLDKYEKYIEGNDSKADYYSAKAENYTSMKNKNKMLDKQIALLIKNNNKAQSTANTTASNFKDSISDISTANKADKKKSTSDEKKVLSNYYKQVKTYTKAKKEISSSLITKISNAGFGNLAQACENYNASLIANETAQDTAKLMAETAKTEVANLQKAKFDNISSAYENKQQHITDSANILNSKKDLATTKGYLSSQSWYNQLIALESKNKSSLTKELVALENSLNEGLSNGSIKEYSSQWYDMVDAINATKQSLEQSKITLEEYKNELRQVEFDNFNYKMEQFSRLMSEADFFKDMMSNKDMTKDGSLTEYGMASLGLSMQNYDAYLTQAQYYASEIQRIKAMLADDPYDTELIAQLQEYEDAQRSALSATEDQKQAIIDLMKEGYSALVDSLSEVVTEYKEMLNAAKNAYDYQNTISEKSETAENLRKQIAAYENMSGNAEIASKLQQANKELKEVEKDIQETMYDKYISDTENILDETLNDLETFIEELDFEEIFDDAMETVEGNTKDIAETLKELADTYGISISDAMKSVWTNGYTPEKGFTSVIGKLDELIAVSDKQADKVAYNEAKGNYTDTSSYEKAIDKANKKVTSLTSQKDNVGADLESAKKAYSESLKKTESLQNEYDTLKAQMDISEAKMANAKSQYSTKSEQYQNAKKEYESFAMMVLNAQKRLEDSKATTSQRYDSVERLQSEYDNIVALLKSAKSEKKTAESALSSVVADNKKVITTFLKAIVNYDAEKPEGELADKIASITGGGVLESHNMSQLATLLGCSNSESDILSRLKLHGFKKGSRNIPYDQLAWTQENGGEIIIRKADGAMLTPLGAGDKVFTSEMSERLWEFAKMNPIPFKDVKVAPTLPVFEKATGGNVTIDMGGITMYGVNNVQEFRDNLTSAIQNDKRVQRVLDSHMNSSMLGKNSLASKRH